MGTAGKELVTALASMTRRMTKGANVHVHLRVSHDMYLANHEARGDPHHHILSKKDTLKKGMPEGLQGKYRKTTFQTKSRLKNEVFE